MRGAVEAHVLEAALHAERVQAAVVVVGRAVAAVRGDVEEVGALDEAQALEREPDLRLAREPPGRKPSMSVLVP